MTSLIHINSTLIGMTVREDQIHLSRFGCTDKIHFAGHFYAQA